MRIMCGCTGDTGTRCKMANHALALSMNEIAVLGMDLGQRANARAVLVCQEHVTVAQLKHILGYQRRERERQSDGAHGRTPPATL